MSFLNINTFTDELNTDGRSFMKIMNNKGPMHLDKFVNMKFIRSDPLLPFARTFVFSVKILVSFATYCYVYTLSAIDYYYKQTLCYFLITLTYYIICDV